jgi:uncharacterized repeat protein (TIGR01451 family)
VTGPGGVPGSQLDAGPGDALTYTLSFTNKGPYTATQVVITDQIPVSLTQRAFTNSGAVIVNRAASPDYVWDVEDLGKDTGGTITITGVLSEPLAEGTFTNTAIITTSVEEQQETDNVSAAVVTVVHNPDLSISKTVEPSENVAYQSEVTYTIILNNAGWGSAVDTQLTDTLPAEVDFSSWVVGGRPVGATQANDQIRWQGQVTAMEAITFTFLVSHVGTYGDQVTNTAEYSHTSGSGSAEAGFWVQPFNVTISGPATGVTATDYVFTATVGPAATFPLTYTWQASGQTGTQVNVAARLTDTITYNWPATGAETVTVAVSDMMATVTATHVINIGP